MWSEAEKKRFRDSDRRFNIGVVAGGTGFVIAKPIGIAFIISSFTEKGKEIPHLFDYGVGLTITGFCLMVVGAYLAKEAFHTGGRATHPLFHD